jgi:superfamily II DNA or RNA helicase
VTDLRDYQASAVYAIERSSRAIYVLPTGGGKTVVAAAVIERAVERGEPQPPSPEVLSWVRSRVIAWVKAQEKARAA